MGKLVYSTSLSLDGYIDASAGDPSWVYPTRSFTGTSTILSGRSIPSCTAAACTNLWLDTGPRPTRTLRPPVSLSNTLNLEASLQDRFLFDPPKRRMELAPCKRRCNRRSHSAEGPSRQVLGVGGVVLASALASAGLIDEYRLYYVPIFLGAGKAAFRRFRTGSDSNRWRPARSLPAPCS